MNKIQKITGFFFLLITTSVVSLAGSASGLQKDQSTNLNNSNQQPIEVYARSTSYDGGDPDTDRGETATGIGFSTAEGIGLHAVSADPALFPYGSIVIHQTPNKRRKVGVVLDTGGAVVNCTAAKDLAKKKKYSENSREAKAPVLDFYAHEDITHEWDTFVIIRYIGPNFISLKRSEKLAYLKKVKEQYGATAL